MCNQLQCLIVKLSCTDSCVGPLLHRLKANISLNPIGPSKLKTIQPSLTLIAICFDLSENCVGLCSGGCCTHVAPDIWETWGLYWWFCGNCHERGSQTIQNIWRGGFKQDSTQATLLAKAGLGFEWFLSMWTCGMNSLELPLFVVSSNCSLFYLIAWFEALCVYSSTLLIMICYYVSSNVLVNTLNPILKEKVHKFSQTIILSR